MPKKSEKKIAEEFKKTQAEARATYGIPDKKIIQSWNQLPFNQISGSSKNNYTTRLRSILYTKILQLFRTVLEISSIPQKNFTYYFLSNLMASELYCASLQATYLK